MKRKGSWKIIVAISGIMTMIVGLVVVFWETIKEYFADLNK